MQTALISVGARSPQHIGQTTDHLALGWWLTHMLPSRSSPEEFQHILWRHFVKFLFALDFSKGTPFSFWRPAEVWEPTCTETLFFNKVFVVIQREITCFYAHFLIEKYCNILVRCKIAQLRSPLKKHQKLITYFLCPRSAPVLWETERGGGRERKRALAQPLFSELNGENFCECNVYCYFVLLISLLFII
jgi:hypothetical protein